MINRGELKMGVANFELLKSKLGGTKK